jgi:hypothetical protein
VKKYYSIYTSLNRKIMGTLPQMKEVVYNCNVSDDPSFIDKFPFEKIEVEPILANAVLYEKSKQTDLINTGGIGFSFGSIVISDRFKILLEQFNLFGVQFFPTYILQKGKRIDNYWQTHIYEIPYGYINFKNTDLLVKDRDENRNPIQYYLDRVANKDDFLMLAQSMKYPKMLFLKNVSFIEKMDLDYFLLRNFGGANHGIVSEKLKNEIEKQAITGVEFKPIELDINDWFGSNGIREKTYGRVPQMLPDGSTRK